MSGCHCGARACRAYLAQRRHGLSEHMVDALRATHEDGGSQFADQRTSAALERRGLAVETGRTRGVRHMVELTDRGRAVCAELFGGGSADGPQAARQIDGVKAE